jgi:ribosomal protein L9
LRINFLQSLVHGLCVAAEKRETEGTKEKRTKEVAAVQKNIATKTKDKKEIEKKKVSIRAAVLSLFRLFCVTTFVSRLTSLSKV